METLDSPVEKLKQATEQRIDEIQEAYGADRPLPAFAGLMAAYSGALVGLSLLASRRGRLSATQPGDLALYGVATYKLSRILAKDPITSPIRAPFTRLEGTTGPAELKEEVRGTGWRHAVGELLSCPFCLGQWIATGFLFGGMFFPRFTRAAASTFVVHAVSDALQFGHSALEQAVD